jgi:hypothetical protein
MTVEGARAEYAATVAAISEELGLHARGALPGPSATCRHCHWLAHVLEGAQIAIDLAVSEESWQRLRKSIP